ncbi:MAG: protein kinase [Pseudomonadota bacterium]
MGELSGNPNFDALVGELFDAALDFSDMRERARYLEEATKNDLHLRHEVESLLQAHEDAGDFLESDVVAEAASALPGEAADDELIGQRLGSWQLDSVLGAGGMGSVFAATREMEGFSQRGAIKLVRIGFETPDLVEGFTRERQLLASIEHPRIARLLDGGTTTDGLPWLAMELVEGEAIDAYANKRRLTINQRLSLFDQLVEAIAYLHQRLIIHQDIKPGNVLVDGNGHVRVLDFGISGLLSESAFQPDRSSEVRASLAFAAPEQVSGSEISTATDIFGLGVLLYRLLSGCAPISLSSGNSLEENRRLVLESSPQLASSAVSRSAELEDIALKRSCSPQALRQQLAGDADAILVKAMAKDPADRYASVTDLLRDLQRFRSGQPVLAREQTTLYRSGKFVLRHRLGLAATAALFVLLIASLAVTTWQAERIKHQRDRAEAMNSFMQEVLSQADPYNAGDDRTVREALESASTLLDERFESQPLLELGLRQTVGDIQVRLSDLEPARRNLERAISLAHANLAEDDGLRLRAELNLAWLLYREDSFDAAIDRYEGVLKHLDSGHPDSMRRRAHNDLGTALSRQGRYAEAVDQLERSLNFAEHAPKERAATLINLGYSYGYMEQYDIAETYYLEAITSFRSLGIAGETAQLAYALNNYGRILAKQERFDEALEHYRASLQMRRRVFGESTYAVGMQHLNIGRLLLEMNRNEQARRELEQANKILPALREEDSFPVVLMRGSLARAEYLTESNAERRTIAWEQLKASLEVLEGDALRPRTERFARQFREWLADLR